MAKSREVSFNVLQTEKIILNITLSKIAYCLLVLSRKLHVLLKSVDIHYFADTFST